MPKNNLVKMPLVHSSQLARTVGLTTRPGGSIMVLSKIEGGELMASKAREGLVDLVEDDNGLWTLPKREYPLPPAMEFPVKVVKFFEPTRVCPIHGLTKVIDRNFNPKGMYSTEGLDCGHVLLITRLTNGLKSRKLVGGEYIDVVLNSTTKNNPTFWRHRGWWLNFKASHRQ